MSRFKFITFGVISALFLYGCSEILEPVSLYVGKQNVPLGADQEEFEINIKSLTFETAKIANNAPYSRKLIFTGNGSRANVLDEAYFLKPNFPKSSNSPNYLLGVGDVLKYNQLNEYVTEIAQWPSTSKESEYLLGPGDMLIFLQSNDNHNKISVTVAGNGSIQHKDNKDSLIETQGVIGSNGNVLLFGLGNILAANRSIDDVRTEVRNILIRDGLAPNFQLEISEFNSQKAYVTHSDTTSDTISLNSLPITLKQIALSANLSMSSKNFALINLTRNDQTYRFTASQLFDPKAPAIVIQNNDQIEIKTILNKSSNVETAVGPKGNILIPNVGSVYALNKTLDDIHEEISAILIEKGIKPNFQINLKKYSSKKVYLTQKNARSAVITLTNLNTTLRQLIFENLSSPIPTDALTVITLKRNGQVFQMTKEQILDPKSPHIWLADEDHIEIESLSYKLGQVFALGGAGNAEMIQINPSIRENLADILFTQKGALNNLMAKRSEVYLLRGQNPSVAYHLDAQNVSRILVAAKTELRPNDIVYVADRPIISFSRTLSELIPLRKLLSDIQDNNIP